MNKTRPRLTRGTAALIIVLAALTLTAAVVARGLPDGIPAALLDVSTADGRVKYLSGLGWKVDPASERSVRLMLPEKFAGVMADYNDMQKQQGFDLEKFAGQQCTQYTYAVTNYPEGGSVLATLYVRGHRVIGGDIHSASVEGFMHALK